MSESTKLFPDGSAVQLLVGVDGRDGQAIEAGATGVVESVSEVGRSYLVRFRGSENAPADATAVVEAGNLILE